MLSVPSYNRWADVIFLGQSLDTIMDFVPNQILLPFGGFLVALYVVWLVTEKHSLEALVFDNSMLFNVWHKLAPLAVVPAVLIIFISVVMV